MMLDRIVEVFCEVDDFCQAFVPQWEPSLLGPGGPQPGLSTSEIISKHRLPTILSEESSRARMVRPFEQSRGWIRRRGWRQCGRRVRPSSSTAAGGRVDGL